MRRILITLVVLILGVRSIQAQGDFVPNALSYSADGQYVAGVGGNRVVVWDGTTGSLLANISLPRREFARLADASWSPDDDLLAVASDDRRVRVLDFSRDAQPFGSILADVELATNLGVRSIAWSPDGTLIAIGGDGIAPQLEFRDGRSYEFIRQSTYTVAAYRMSWNPDPQRGLIATTDIFLNGSQLADVAENAAGVPVRVCNECAEDAIALPVAWNSDGTLLAIGHNDGAIFIVNVETNTVLVNIQTAPGVSVLAWTNDDSSLISMSRGGLQVWDSVTGSLRYSPTAIRMGRFDINPGSNQLFFYDSQTAPLGEIIDVSTLTSVERTPTATAPTAAPPTPTAATVPTITPSRAQSVSNRIEGFAYSAPREVIAVIVVVLDDPNRDSGRYIDLYNARTGLLIGSLEPLDSRLPLQALDFNAAGNLLATVNENNAFQVFDIDTLTRVFGIGNGVNSVAAIAWNPIDNDRLATTFANTVDVNDVLSSEPSFYFGTDGPFGRIRAMDWSPDGQRIATASIGGPDSTGYISVWDTLNLNRNSLVSEPTLRIAGTRTNSLDWAPTGTQLAAGRRGGAVVFDPNTGTEIIRMETDQVQSVSEVQWSPDGSQLAAGAENGVWVWNVTTGEVAAHYPTSAEVMDIAWLPNGQILHNNGTIGLAVNGAALDEYVLPGLDVTATPAR